MFTDNKDESIRALGEVELIAAIREWLGDVSPPSPAGIGDDCAVIDTSEATRHLLTTDSVSYGHHFDDSVSAHDAGAKLIKRNLSDIAAMGGQPGQALLSLLCGGDLSIEWLHDFIEGIRETCERYELPLVGGDISALADGQFSSVLSLTGYIEHPPLLRSGAQAGDWIYVTGTLGGSIRGKHYNFEPRLKEGQWLAQCGNFHSGVWPPKGSHIRTSAPLGAEQVQHALDDQTSTKSYPVLKNGPLAQSGTCSALMDITDGLAKDLRELLPTQCAAHLELDLIPLSEEAQLHANDTGRSVLEHAFCDGEDYELLFAIKSETDLAAFEQSWKENFPETPLTRIGQFCPSTGDAPYIDARTKEALPWQKGFEHLG